MKIGAAILAALLAAGIGAFAMGFTGLLTSGDGTGDYIVKIWLFAMVWFIAGIVIAAIVFIFAANFFSARHYSPVSSSLFGLLISVVAGIVFDVLGIIATLVVYAIAWEMR